VQEQEHASAGLIADSRGLLVTDGSGEKQGRLAGTRRRDHDPALILRWNVGVFKNLEPELIDVEGERLIVLADDQRYLAYGLAHRRAVPKSREAGCAGEIRTVRGGCSGGTTIGNACIRDECPREQQGAGPNTYYPGSAFSPPGEHPSGNANSEERRQEAHDKE